MNTSVGRQRLPSLNALRVFEAAARHLNLTRAAEELCVSQSAVSHQISNLEADLNAKLLIRTTRKLELTTTGKALASSLATAFDTIAIAWDRANQEPSDLSVLSAPTIGLRVLLPPLEQKGYCVDSINIKVTCSLGYQSLGAGGFDVGICFGDDSTWQNEHAELLLSEWLMPLCSSVYKEKHGIQGVQDFNGATLLHSSEDQRDWQIWAEAADLNLSEATDHLAFETLDVAFRAANEGYGILVGDASLLATQAHKTNLVPAVDLKVPSGKGYYFVCHPDRLNEPAIEKFRNWLIELLSGATKSNFAPSKPTRTAI
ncbi:LysR family transcriptional regulator [Ruegeria atlantica]|uniref:LysR family transcriptional regulator n=1 Tax=Ruegeria atlantica TaxID=81569 RepID=UPI00147C190F|nr:LysR family transcriptional regulator [Ruegeria atlantica]